MPLSVPVPLPLSTKLTPVGSAPFSLMVGVGAPVDAIINDPLTPIVKLALSALVIAGALVDLTAVVKKPWLTLLRSE